MPRPYIDLYELESLSSSQYLLWEEINKEKIFSMSESNKLPDLIERQVAGLAIGIE